MLKLSTVMPYLKMIQKIYTLLEVCRYQYFFAENQQIWLHKEIYILIEFSYIIANFFKFFWGIKDCFKKKMVTNLIMSAKRATLDFLKIKVFWNKCYSVIISVHDVTNKILSHDSNHIGDVAMWPKFSKSSISTRRVITTSISYGFDQKKHFF